MSLKSKLALSGLLLSLSLAGPTAATSYPEKPIRIIAPIAVGGLTDTLARLVAAGLAEQLKQPVIVDNRPGAGGIIGMEAAAKAVPDGYTLILAYQGVAAVNASLYESLPYDTLRDFMPVAGLGTFPMVLVTSPGKHIKSVDDFVSLAKEKPNTLSYASAGNATTSHLTMELFKKESDIQVLHVPYKGEGPANTDVVGGQVDIAFSSLASVMPLIRAQRLLPLGIGTLERSEALPNVPTISQSGMPGFEAIGWYGLLAPAQTPPAIVAHLSETIQRVLNEPAMREKLTSLGVTANPTSSSAFSQQIKAETAKWKYVIQKANIKIN